MSKYYANLLWLLDLSVTGWFLFHDLTNAGLAFYLGFRLLLAIGYAVVPGTHSIRFSLVCLLLVFCLPLFGPGLWGLWLQVSPQGSPCAVSTPCETATLADEFSGQYFRDHHTYNHAISHRLLFDPQAGDTEQMLLAAHNLPVSQALTIWAQALTDPREEIRLMAYCFMDACKAAPEAGLSFPPGERATTGEQRRPTRQHGSGVAGVEGVTGPSLFEQVA